MLLSSQIQLSVMMILLVIIQVFLVEYLFLVE